MIAGDSETRQFFMFLEGVKKEKADKKGRKRGEEREEKKREKKERRVERERHSDRERLDTDTRIFRAHACTRSHFHTIKDTLTPHKHRRRMCVCVCVCVCLCVLLLKKGEQSPSASVYGRGSLTRQPRAD